MAHEITSNDHLVLAGKAAWHGFGTIVEDAPTTHEALKLARMEWNVLETNYLKGYAPTMTADTEYRSDKWKFTVREDTQEILGCVTSGFQPVQNSELAKFCSELSMDSVVRVESAGSLFGGRKVWFLLKADTFNVGQTNGPTHDPITPYILVANGHDGSLSFTGMTTSVRVVCNNTLSWALRGKGKVFSYKHTANIMSRIDEARKSMHNALKGLDNFKDACHHLRRRTMTRAEVQAFFLDVYSHVVDPIVKTTREERMNNPFSRKEETDRRYVNAMENLDKICRNFDDEYQVAGDTYWNAFNATSRWLQDRNRKVGDHHTYNVVMGTAAENTSKAFKMALAAAGT